jgi:hypothetical protein
MPHHLILNLDEIGFGALKTRLDFCFNTPVFKGKTDSHFVTALCAVSTTGDVVLPALTTQCETEHPDSGQSSYIPNARRSLTPKGFVTRQIFSDYLLTVVSPSVIKL